MRHIFIDGIDNMQFSAGLVRMSTFIYTKTPSDAADATESCAFLVTTPQGFASMLRGFEDMASKLIEAGVLHPSVIDDLRVGA